MSDFIEEVRSIGECIATVTDALAFPWCLKSEKIPLRSAWGRRIAYDIEAREPNPPFTRSLRDGYALDHSYTAGASFGAPVFLRLADEIRMGATPDIRLASEETASIPTGGMMPEGADSVVMIEDTERAGDWIQVYRSVQQGENVLFAGEEIRARDTLMRRGEILDLSVSGLLAAQGIAQVETVDISIGVLSTGDEIVPAETETKDVPAGFIRDANSFILISTLAQYGFHAQFAGIVPDSERALEEAVAGALLKFDVVLLSGGSSVGVRDHSSKIIQNMAAPGLLVHGINMIPGKPTLIGGSRAEKKLVFGLPGHPLSCLVTCLFVVLPTLLNLIGATNAHIGRSLALPLRKDIQGKTGPDEFVPMKIENGGALPLAAKSGYVSAMRGCDGFIVMRSEQETLRAGEKAEVWMW